MQALGVLRESSDRGLKVGGLESERTRPALERNASLAIHEIQPLRPPAVGAVGRVVEVIDDGRELDAQSRDADIRERGAFVGIRRARKDHVIAQVVRHLPRIARMRLTDVHHEERDRVPVAVEEGVQGGNLPPERRSRVAAKDQHDGLLPTKRRQRHFE
jgi:hypothetical protein